MRPAHRTSLLPPPIPKAAFCPGKAEEAGSLLDSYTLISESDGTLVYELTAAEYTALLQQLEQQGLAIAGAATAEEAEADGTILVHVIPG